MRASTHSFASFVELVVICIVSFVSISLFVITFLRTATMVVVSGMHSVWMMHVAREQ